jgi:uncharacterized protein (DUF58 family)
MQHLLAFIVVFFALAAVLRIDFFFYILYVLFGVYFLSGLWVDRAVRGLTVSHAFEDRAFPGERITVSVQLRNGTILPLPWLRLHESLPIQLKSPNFYRCVVSLLPRETRTLSYDLECRRRGFYRLGPLTLHTGDLLGVRMRERRIEDLGALIVYPRIIPLARLGLAAQTPLGEVPARHQLYHDPTRMIGVRAYQSGDSLRHIHWKTSAATGALQVKRFEPAISWQAQLFVNLNRGEYNLHRYITASELAIVVAASVAHYLIEKRQEVGLSSNGLDPLAEETDGYEVTVAPRKGRDHLMRILDVLARVRLAEDRPFVDLVRRARLHLTWGGTAIIITAHADDALFDAMLLLQRSGYHILLIVVDPHAPFADTKAHAQAVGIAAHQIWQESDLDVWR